MPTYKNTWFFSDATYNVGWTESWYVTAADINTAYTATSNYPSVRKALLMSTSTINYVRCANIDHPRDSLITTLVGIAGTIVTATYPLAGVWDVLLCRRDVAAWNYFNSLYMRFVPAFVFAGRLYNPTGGGAAAWNTAFTAMQTEVTSGPYLVRKLTAGPSYTYSPCIKFIFRYRTERRLGRPSDPLRGRRATA